MARAASSATARASAAVLAAIMPDQPRRVWQGIESDDPPPARHDYAQLLATAEQMLAAREKRFPALVTAGRIKPQAAELELSIFRAIVADWRWICTGEGEPAPIATLDLRRSALDRSITTIAEIACDEGGFSNELAAQADCVIAMRWHLEPGRRTHALAQLTHTVRAGLAAAAPSSGEADHAA